MCDGRGVHSYIVNSNGEIMLSLFTREHDRKRYGNTEIQFGYEISKEIEG